MATIAGKYMYDLKYIGKFDPTLTQKSIAKKPFSSKIKLNAVLISQWIQSVVPSGVRGFTQESFTTFQVLNELYLVEYSVIREALSYTGYFWDFSDVPSSFEIKRRLYKIANPNEDEYDRISERKPSEIDMALWKRKIEDLNILYDANGHNTDVLKQIVKALVDILGKAGEAYDEVNTKKKEMEILQEELLNHSRAGLRANIYRMSKSELTRLRIRPPPPGMTDHIVPQPRVRPIRR
jgi:hypothetical protein